MAITKTTKLKKVEVYPRDEDQNVMEPIVSVHLQDSWDDPDDDQLPLVKERVITRGRAVDPDKTPIDDLPTLAREIARMVWYYD